MDEVARMPRRKPARVLLFPTPPPPPPPPDIRVEATRDDGGLTITVTCEPPEG